MIRLLIPFLMFIGFFSCLQATGQPNAFVSFRNYSQQDGLSSYNITKILQDPYGFLWIGTQDGVNCFDGRHFTALRKESDTKHHIPGNNITDMVLDSSRGLLWVATSLGGVAAISILTHAVVSTLTDNPNDAHYRGIWIHSLCVAGDTLWIGAYGGLFAYNIATRHWLPPGFTAGLLHSPDVARLVRDSAGTVWAFCNGRGIFALPRGARNFGLTDQLPADLRIWNVFDAGEKGMFMATTRGLLRIAHDSAYATLYTGEIFACTSDRSGRLWFTNATSLLRLDPTVGGTIEKIADINQGTNSWQSTIYALFTDRDGDVWAGSEEGLSFLSLAPQPFEKFSNSFFSKTRIQHAFTIHVAADSLIYCGASNGLYKINPLTRDIARIDEGNSYYMMEQLAPHQLLVASNRGPLIAEGDKLTPAALVYPFLSALSHDQLCASVRFNDSLLIFGSQLQKGLYVCDIKNKKIRNFSSANSSLAPDNDVINGLFKDSSGRLWVLSINTIFQFDPLTGAAVGHHVLNPSTGDKYGIFFDMCEVAGSFWIAAYGQGLIETDKQLHVRRTLDAKDGLANNGVYRLFPYRDSLIFITSNNGLSTLTTRGSRIVNYYAGDGLQSNAFEQFCGTTYNGLIYAGGIEGFTQINPALLGHPRPGPDIFISRITTGLANGVLDTTDLALRQLEIPADALLTTVFFSLPEYRNPSGPEIEYRISEISGKWIGLNGQDFISLIGLAPRSYTLEVRARGNDSSQPRQLRLIFLPKWYQTWWFAFLVLAVVVALLYALYNYRISQLRRQQQIRKEIAGDLHDDIGSTLNSIKIFTHLAQRDAEKDTHFARLEESLTQATIGLRDMIWVLDNSEDTVGELLDRIRRFAAPVARAKDIRFECTCTEQLLDKKIPKPVKRNLLLIAKEAVNNSIKYAECRQIKIEMKSRDNKLSLSIHDDGKGFNPDEYIPGNGLRNIRHRAKQISFIVTIQSSRDTGTLIEAYGNAK